MEPTRNDIFPARRIWHCSGALSVILIHSLVKEETQRLILLMLAIVTLLLLDLGRIFMKMKSPMDALLRREERGKMSGSFWFMMGIGLSYFLYPERVFVLSVLYLGFGDPAAALIGRQYDQKLNDRKSLQGTLAAMGVCILVTLFMGENIAVSIIAGMLGGLSELVDVVDDNLCIPIVSGFLLTLLGIE